jgi:putative thioredoxin
MVSNFIIDVNEQNFEYEVLKYSNNTPVVVDFWASWCRPCLAQGPLLERLATEGQGTFRLAKVDTDANPTLAITYGVRSLPTLKAFVQGEVVAEMVGAQPEGRLRELLASLMPPSPAALSLEKADGLLSLHEWSGAERTYREVLTQTPGQPAPLLGLAKSLLAQNKAKEALGILFNFPASKLYIKAEELQPLAQALYDLQNGRLSDESELDNLFMNAVRLASRGNNPAALDGLLEILRQNKRYGDGKARQVFVGILNIMGEEDPDTRLYRTELASVLF